MKKNVQKIKKLSKKWTFSKLLEKIGKVVKFWKRLENFKTFQISTILVQLEIIRRDGADNVSRRGRVTKVPLELGFLRRQAKKPEIS